jgi:hypothetical protein
MTNPPIVVITRHTPTAANPTRQQRHHVDQSLWLALFDRYRQPSTIPTPGQRPHEQPQRQRRQRNP